MQTETKSIHTFQEGELFDNRYRLVKRAGSGGFADVWKAEDTLRKNRVVALKIYTRLDEEGIKEMSDEYDQTEDIRHPNLLTGNHFATVGNIPYLEMRYCDGGSLASHVGRMGNDELRHMLRDVCSGLAYLHAEGIVHQDIKPENILLDTKHDRYMLADFGISGKSRSRLSKSAKMASDIVAMTAAYAPPEKLSANPIDRTPSTKGDIFSLGVTLYELATGNLPVDLPQSTGQLLLISQGRQPLYFDNIADPQLRQIVQRCMSYRKEDRPTAEDVLAMLDGKSSESKQPGQEQPKKSSYKKPPTEKNKVNPGGQAGQNPPRPPKPPTQPINKNKLGNKIKNSGFESKKKKSIFGHIQVGFIFAWANVCHFFKIWHEKRTPVEFYTELSALILLIAILFTFVDVDYLYFVREILFYVFLSAIWLILVEKICLHWKKLTIFFGKATVFIFSLFLLNVAVCGFTLLFINEHLEWATNGIIGISLSLFFACWACFSFKQKQWGYGIFFIIFAIFILLPFLFFY